MTILPVKIKFYSDGIAIIVKLQTEMKTTSSRMFGMRLTLKDKLST
jgi:hypothetical protein